jgi:hypothetical protein
MPIAQGYRTRQNKSHGSTKQSQAINQHPNFRSIKITVDHNPQIGPTDNTNDATLHQTTDPAFFDEGLGTEFDSVEQNIDPPNLTNNDNKQRPVLIHMQNDEVDPDDQIYNRDDQENEPYFPIRAEFWTNDTPTSDEQSINMNTYTKNNGSNSFATF